MSKCRSILCLPRLAARQPCENSAVYVAHQQLTCPAISFPNRSLKVTKFPPAYLKKKQKPKTPFLERQSCYYQRKLDVLEAGALFPLILKRSIPPRGRSQSHMETKKQQHGYSRNGGGGRAKEKMEHRKEPESQ